VGRFQHGGTVGIDIHACDVWNVTTGDINIIVAVLDHGIELNHPDMPNISALSYDTVTGNSPSQVRGSHGTACAGIVGAARNNGFGVAGIAPNITLRSISSSLVLGPDVQQELADGLNWAWQNGDHVISNSWGHNALASALIDDAIDSALTQGRGGLGTVVVFAAGNENGSVGYPANSNPGILAVGAMSPCGERKSPSSCDLELWGSNFGDELDVMAPGVMIPTADRQGANGYDSSDYTLGFNGTSSACPHVAGVAALILSVNLNLTQQEVVEIIERNTQKVGGYNYQTISGRLNGTWNNEMGYGLVNAFACVNSAQINSNKLPPGTFSSSQTKGFAAERHTAPDGYLQSLPQGPELQGIQPDDTVAQSAGFSWYNNVGVNLNTTLLGTNGTTQISVYARDIRWNYAFGSSPSISSPSGNGGSGGSGWRFPTAHKFGITIYQGSNYWNVTSTSSGSPTVITGLSNTANIIITVNDTNGNYDDNSGAFDIYIRKDN
jgi:subtilisin family serine protease